MLEMGLAKYGLCWKFEDSDMFCLDENGGDLYFVYSMNDEIGSRSKVTENQIENEYLNLIEKDIGNNNQFANKNAVNVDSIRYEDWKEIGNKENYGYNIGLKNNYEGDSIQNEK